MYSDCKVHSLLDSRTDRSWGRRRQKGLVKTKMTDIAELMKKLLIDKKDPKKVRSEVADFRKDFQEIKYCFQTPNKAYEYLKFY